MQVSGEEETSFPPFLRSQDLLQSFSLFQQITRGERTVLDIVIKVRVIATDNEILSILLAR